MLAKPPGASLVFCVKASVTADQGARWQKNPHHEVRSLTVFHSRAELKPEVTASLEVFPVRLFCANSQLPDLSKAGALCLWPGRGNVARELLRLGCPWVLVFEPARSAAEDLHRSELRCQLRELVSLGAFSAVFAVPLHDLGAQALEKVRRETAVNEWLAELKPSASSSSGLSVTLLSARMPLCGGLYLAGNVSVPPHLRVCGVLTFAASAPAGAKGLVWQPTLL